MNTLGLNAFHGDSAAAVIRDGVLVAAAEEERFRRVKHWAGLHRAGDRKLPRSRRVGARPLAASDCRLYLFLFGKNDVFCVCGFDQHRRPAADVYRKAFWIAR
jgi:hypothetical protein